MLLLCRSRRRLQGCGTRSWAPLPELWELSRASRCPAGEQLLSRPKVRVRKCVSGTALLLLRVVLLCTDAGRGGRSCPGNPQGCGMDLAADGLLLLRSPTALMLRPARSGWQPRAPSRGQAALHAAWRKSAAGHGRHAELVVFSNSHDNLWPLHSSRANCSSELLRAKTQAGEGSRGTAQFWCPSTEPEHRLWLLLPLLSPSSLGKQIIVSVSFRVTYHGAGNLSLRPALPLMKLLLVAALWGNGYYITVSSARR